MVGTCVWSVKRRKYIKECYYNINKQKNTKKYMRLVNRNTIIDWTISRERRKNFFDVGPKRKWILRFQNLILFTLHHIKVYGYSYYSHYSSESMILSSIQHFLQINFNFIHFMYR